MSQPDYEVSLLIAALSHTTDAACRLIASIQCSGGSRSAPPSQTHNHELVSQDHSTSNGHGVIHVSSQSDLDAIARTFSLLLHGLDKHDQQEGGRSTRERLIYCYVRIFQTILERICFLSTHHSEEPTDQSQNQATHCRKKVPKCLTCRERRLKCDQRTPKCRNCQKKGLKCDRAIDGTPSVQEHLGLSPKQTDQTIIKLCELSITMMGYLDLGKPLHRSILEGFIFILFNKIGKGIRHFVLDVDEEATTQEEQRDGNVNHTPAVPNHSGHREGTEVEAQAPYLIWILERTQPFLSQQSNITNTSDPNSIAEVESAASSARTKLQYTLLKAMFGDQASLDYGPSLEPPKAPTASELPTVDVPEADVKDWFKHEVWRLVGWDILRNHRWKSP